MKTYEITYLTLSEESHDAKSISGILSANHAKIVSVNPWGGRRKLAYPINKQDQAFYTTVVFEAETSAIKPMETALKLNDDVLRSLIVEFEPGVFQRTEETRSGETRADKADTKPESTEPVSETAEAKTEEVAAPAEEKIETTAETEASTETTAKTEEKADEAKATSDTDNKEELDKKIDELLSEDITA